MNILLTKRDLLLLQDLFTKSVMSFAQISKVHFTGLAKQTTANRLNRLVRAGFIAKHRAGIIIYNREPQVIEMVYTIGRFGQRFLSDRFPELRAREHPTGLNTYTLVHDLMLSDLVESLKLEFHDYTIRNGKHIAAQTGQFQERVPDLILARDSAIAVELELTQKSDRRIREIILSYRINQNFDKVLYFSTDPRILQKIYKELTGFEINTVDFSSTVVASKFELRLLSKGDPPANILPAIEIQMEGELAA